MKPSTNAASNYITFENVRDDPKEFKKLESMRETIHKATAKYATDNWRKHIAVHGWCTMNYPSSIRMSLREKYKDVVIDREKLIKEEYEARRKSFLPDISRSQLLNKDARRDSAAYDPLNHFRLDPNKVNKYVMDDGI